MFKCFTRMFHFSCNGFSLFAGKPLRTNTPFSTRAGKSLAGEQALLCGRAKRVSRERASERRSPSALRSLVLARHAQIGELSRRLEKAKIVECKIRSMRSRLLFLLSGVFSPVGRHHLKRTWTRSRDLTEFPGCKGVKTRWMCKKKLLFLFSRCLACGSIHQGVDPKRFSDESRGKREIFRDLAALFAHSRIGGFHAISGDTNNNGEMNKCWWTNRAS